MSVQRVARKIASVYQLDVGMIIVSFHGDADFAGRIELHGGRDFFIELNSKLMPRPRDIAATLGHEIAHIFLNRHGLRLKPESANEIPTDTAAALYGFGILYADTFVITETPIIRNERKIGYLMTEEIGYVMEHSGIVEYGFWGGPVDLTSDDARGPFRKGCQKAHRELSKPPLTSTGEIDRFVYICRRRWYRWWNNDEILTLHRHYAFQKGGVAFRCPICTQAMRLPLGKSVISQCPNCESDVESHT